MTEGCIRRLDQGPQGRVERPLITLCDRCEEDRSLGFARDDGVRMKTVGLSPVYERFSAVSLAAKVRWIKLLRPPLLHTV
jgi:hypothetical protein